MRAKKRFGQHFLHDQSVVQRIVAALAPQSGELLVEIGPGHGALTRPVLQRASPLLAIEIDPELSRALTAMPEAADGRLQVHTGDALSFDFAALGAGHKALRVFGNLPYNIATELLFRLLTHAHLICDMHFMVQKEVAQRLVAEPGSKARGRLGVMVQSRCRVERLFTVPPGAFTPPPAVDSAVVRILPRESVTLGPGTRAVFADLVRLAFQQRRKTLRNALRERLDDAAIRDAGVDPGSRAETLTNDQFVKLAEQFALRRKSRGRPDEPV